MTAQARLSVPTQETIRIPLYKLYKLYLRFGNLLKFVANLRL
jgi:hypothetical protein